MTDVEIAVSEAAEKARMAIDIFSPHHIVTMVSGGRDSAACHALAVEIGLPITMTIHGRTGCGLPATQRHVEQNYGNAAPLIVADAGTAYEDYVLRKGFFGKGVAAHGFAYRILKAQPFRKTISSELCKGKTGVRVMLLNGARQDESEYRSKNLRRARPDPAAPSNVWFNLIHDWSATIRDAYLASRGVAVSPVANALCRSGECMCGTMQSRAERIEAAAFDPEWGAWLDDLEAEARSLHGFGWGEPMPKGEPAAIGDLFMPMCVDCGKGVDNA